MEEEGVLPGDVALPEEIVEEVEAAAQRLPEAGLLPAGHLAQEVVLAHEIGVRAAHRLYGGVDQGPGDLALEAEQAGVADGPADHPAQHVAPALVGGQDPVAEQERHRPAVVGQDPQRHVGLGVGAVASAGRGLGHGQDAAQHVGLEHRVLALQQSQDPLQAGAGVDVALGQVRERPVLVAVVLHEHEVPELDVALLAAVRRTPLLAVLRPPVVVQLGAWPAGAGRAHAPEVVLLPHALDALPGNSDGVGPDPDGLVVVVEHGDPDTLRIELEDRRGQLPGQGDGQLLEVVAEGEVAQHLEEGEVPGGRADDVDVDRPEALLDGRGPGPRRLLLPEHVGLELHHPGVGEQQRRVVGHQAGRRLRGVAPGLEEAEEGAS